MRRRAHRTSLRISTLAGIAALLGLAACQTFQTEPVAGSVERGRRLFHEGDFGAPRQTAIPYALYLAMMERFPNELAADWADFRARYGLLRNEREPNGLPVGFALRNDTFTGTPFLMTNCALCHQGEIAGQRIEGIGNRTVRLNAIDNAIMSVARHDDFTSEKMIPAAKAAAEKHELPWTWRSTIAVRFAIPKLKELAERHVALDAGPGRNTPIEFAKAACGVSIAPPYGYVKFPAVWMYRKRASFGYDASFQGDLALAVSAVEFNKGMSSRAILSQPDTWRDVHAYLGSLRAPRFPQPLDERLVEQGRHIYAESCTRCHGDVRQYTEMLFPVHEVGTDPDRLDSVTPALVLARNRTALGQRARLIRQTGYVAPPLDGIWARAPYLHNGSVPTLDDLLRPPQDRPHEFLVGAADYDLIRVGLAQPAQAASGVLRFLASAPGNSNAGHLYGTDLDAAGRRALLEYLKSL